MTVGADNRLILRGKLSLKYEAQLLPRAKGRNGIDKRQPIDLCRRR